MQSWIFTFVLLGCILIFYPGNVFKATLPSQLGYKQLVQFDLEIEDVLCREVLCANHFLFFQR